MEPQHARRASHEAWRFHSAKHRNGLEDASLSVQRSKNERCDVASFLGWSLFPHDPRPENYPVASLLALPMSQTVDRPNFESALESLHTNREVMLLRAASR